MIPPASLLIVTTRAPTKATQPVGASAGTVMASEVPVVGTV